jgi:tripartite-type tricarboxylate transporter receptor subunit TctC
LDASSDYTVFAPAGVPAAVVQTLFSAIKTALQDQTVVAKLHAAGLEPKLLNSADATKVLQDQIARWAALIAEAHIKPDDR